MSNSLNTPIDELDLIDMTVKQFTQPRLVLDKTVLRRRLSEIQLQKHVLRRQADVTDEYLLSDEKFARLLQDRGVLEVEVPTKRSKTTGNMTYAFAKTDSGLKTLAQAHPHIKPLVDARLAIKSVGEERRIERLMMTCGYDGPEVWLPVPLLYYGAHTGRFSGRDKINLQNLGRGSALREAIVAPKGHKIIAADLAQIEARLTACFCGEDKLVKQFADGVDVYSDFASGYYGYRVNKDDHPKERFVGKTAILSLGFQSGAHKFWATMNDVFNTPITFDESQGVVDTYRGKYRRIRNTWYDLGGMIQAMANGRETAHGCVTFKKNKVVLPNGMPIFYHGLGIGSGEWQYNTGKGMTKIYGGKLLENIIQALARIIMTTAAIRLYRHGLMAALHVHDELVFVVKEDKADIISILVKGVMEQKVSWMPDLPVACEVTMGNNYMECK